MVNGIYLSVIALMFVSCGSSQGKFMKRTKQNANADSIRKAVAPLFLKYRYDGNSQSASDVPISAIPEQISSLPLFTFLPKGEAPVLASWVSTNGNALLFYIGSGFGHWGIAVCKDENSHELDNTPSYSYWTNGIYFYDGP